MGVGGAIFETLSRFVNSVDSDDSAAAEAPTATAAAPPTAVAVCDVAVLLLLLLLFAIRLIFNVVLFDSTEPTVELPLAGIRNLILGAGTIFEPCTRFTWRIIPSGAII